ncbi:PAS domain-containing protein, partial [Streptomyces sp. SID625]|nr:PAS domain-containing protein [Streptomyces sp. SID625]
MVGARSTQIGRAQSVTMPCAHLIPALEAIRAAAYVVDEQGRVIAANRRAESLLGRPADELVGHDAHDLLHRGPQGEQLVPSQCGMRQVSHAASPAGGGHEYFEKADGSLLPVFWTIAPYDIGDRRAGTLVVFHTSGQATAPGAAPEQAAGTLTAFERLALLAETTTQLTSTFDTEEALRRLVGLVLPRLADWAVIDLITERDEVWRAAVVQADGDALAHHEDLEGPI